MSSSKKKCDCKCNLKPRKILTSKQAEKQPVGSFYHPTNKTVRSGACPVGFELRKGYERKPYKKGSKLIKSTYVEPVCVKDKGLPGKLLPEYKPISLDKSHVLSKYGYSTKLDDNKRHKTLLEASKDLSYKSVITRLVALRTLTKKTDPEHSKIYNTNIKKLQEWRTKNPELYKKKGSIPNSLKETIDKSNKRSKKIINKKSVSPLVNLFRKIDFKKESTVKSVLKSNKKSKKSINKKSEFPLGNLFRKLDLKKKSKVKTVKKIKPELKSNKSKTEKVVKKSFFGNLFKKLDLKSNKKTSKSSKTKKDITKDTKNTKKKTMKLSSLMRILKNKK